MWGTGISGVPGTLGVPGMPGMEGEPGEPGREGEPGDPGDPGTDGDPGEEKRGTDGEAGELGEAGDPGLGDVTRGMEGEEIPFDPGLLTLRRNVLVDRSMLRERDRRLPGDALPPGAGLEIPGTLGDRTSTLLERTARADFCRFSMLGERRRDIYTAFRAAGAGEGAGCSRGWTYPGGERIRSSGPVSGTTFFGTSPNLNSWIAFRYSSGALNPPR